MSAQADPDGSRIPENAACSSSSPGRVCCARSLESWSAAQYTKFQEERTRPVEDLLARVRTTPVRKAVDLGCGPGNSTEVLLGHFPAAIVIGIDNSADMIEAARKRLPGTRFEVADISAWSNPGPFDVILSNAVLQWVPDHESLLPALLARLAEGGSLAVQIPDNLDEPAHRLMRETAATGPWVAKLSGASEARTAHSVDWYYRMLSAHAANVDIWRTTYYHSLIGGAEAVVEWFKGTGLRPFLHPLETEERWSFLSRYQESIAQAYPALEDGTVLLPFPRLFFVATR